MNFFNKYKLATLALVIFLFPCFAYAGTCSPVGYSIFTINGINTDQREAQENKATLENKLVITTYKNQPLTIDFLYNPTHGKIFDSMDTTNQIYFDQNSLNIQDSDFIQMLTDASIKLNTQKVLLVGHSQGNFYANTFYNAVADEPGGVPSISIGVYGVGSPASSVAGGGLYLTSDTDKMIAGTVAKFPFTNILKPNTHINFNTSDGDPLGHSFSKIYLNYENNKIVSNIKTSLDKLKENDEQDLQYSCISPPKLTFVQKIQGKVLAIIDPVSVPIQNGIVAVGVITYKTGSYIANGLENTYLAIGNGILNSVDKTASAISSLTQSLFNHKNNLAVNNSATVIDSENQTTVTTENNNIQKPAEILLPQTSQTPKIKTTTEETVAEATPPPLVIVYQPEPIVSAGPVVLRGGGGGRNDIISLPVPIVDQNSSGDNQGGGGGISTPPVITLSENNPETVVFPYLENSQNSLPSSLSAGYLNYCHVQNNTPPDFYNFGSKFIVSNGGLNLEKIGVRGFAGSSIVHSAHLDVYIYGDRPSPRSGPLLVSSFITDPSTWSTASPSGTNPLDFPYVYFTFPKTFLPAGNYWFDFGDCISPSSDYFGVKATGSGTSRSSFGDGNSNMSWYHYGGLYWDGSNDIVGFGFDWIINGTAGTYVPLSPLKTITAFNFESLTPKVSGVVDETNHTISLTVPFGTDVNNLIPTITFSDKASVSPNFGIVQNFSNPVTYTVTAEDKSTQNYIVTVIVDPVPPKIKQLIGHMDNGAFYFDTPSMLHNYTKIIYKGHYPDISSPYLYSSVPTSNSSQTVGCGWICSSKNGEYYYFEFQADEGHYVFEVHRIGTEQQWEVIDPFSTVVLDSSKIISAFNFGYLVPAVSGVVDETNHTINLSVPFGTDVKTLMPVITFPLVASISPGNYVAQDFTNPVTYTVTAQDKSTQNYIVTVTVAPDPNIATQLKIITAVQTINKDTASSIITVQTQNSAGESKNAGKTTTLTFNSTSSTGQFSDANSGACNDATWSNMPFTLSMHSNWASKNFCYRDSTASTPGTYTITISAPGLNSDSQIFSVN